MSGFSEWLADVKDVHASEALAVGLPTKRVESWKYVPTRGLARTTWQPAVPQTTRQFALTAGQFVNVPTDNGLTVSENTLTASEQERLDGISQAHGFGLTQAALEDTHLILTVQRAMSVVLNLSHLANQASSAGFAALIIRAEAGAQLTLVEQFESTDVEKAN